MRHTARLLGTGTLVVLASLASGHPSAAQDDPDPMPGDLVPEGFPGEYDITEADAAFGQLADAYGRSTDVADFGDGSRLTGPCGGFAFSYDEDGGLIDAALDLGDAGPPVDLLGGGQAFTAGNPFEVDTRGQVVYFGFAPMNGDGPIDHRWSITTSGISVDSGGDPNSDAKNRNAGVVDLGEELPVKFTAVVRVSGEMSSQNLASCTGEGHVKFLGNGLTDPVGLGALALLGGGLVGILFNARPAWTWKE